MPARNLFVCPGHNPEKPCGLEVRTVKDGDSFHRKVATHYKDGELCPVSGTKIYVRYRAAVLSRPRAAPAPSAAGGA